jgi:hypothetical protein
MSNTTYSAAAFKPAASNDLPALLRELFRATPLYIFATAAKTAFNKPVAR